MCIRDRPKGFSLASYGKVFANPNIISGYKNTIFILVVGVILCLLMTSLGAYVLSRKDLLFRKPLMMIIMFTMFFTGGLILSLIHIFPLFKIPEPYYRAFNKPLIFFLFTNDPQFFQMFIYNRI